MNEMNSCSHRLDKRHKDEHPEYKYRPRRKSKGVKRGYNAPTMMMSPAAGVGGKPYAIPTQWTRVIQTAEGESIAASPRAETPQIIYTADGTQYYAVGKAGTSGFTPTMSAHPSGSVIIPPTQVATPQQLANVAAATTTTPTTNYPAYVTVPIPATSTAIFHPVAIPVQGVHTPAFVLRPPGYPGSTVYSPTILHPATTNTTAAVPLAYQNIDHRTTIETQTATKTESTNTIVKTADGETIVIIQRPMDGAVPSTTTALSVATQPHIFQQHIVHQPAGAHAQSELKEILIEQQQPTHTTAQST